jgi:hypothetical protein
LRTVLDRMGILPEIGGARRTLRDPDAGDED